MNLRDLIQKVLSEAGKATPRPWTQERVDHDEEISFEIGPSVDGSHGFRFVLYESGYEFELKSGEFRSNVAKLKGDAHYIVTSANSAEPLARALLVTIEALEKISKYTIYESNSPYERHLSWIGAGAVDEAVQAIQSANQIAEKGA